jgi:hypothetical protein
MSLVVGTVLLVTVFTALIGLAGYLLDRRTSRQERREQ